MSLSRVRGRIEALERKLALPIAEEFCDQREAASADEKAIPPSRGQPTTARRWLPASQPGLDRIGHFWTPLDTF